jgi:hypothetical protein
MNNLFATDDEIKKDIQIRKKIKNFKEQVLMHNSRKIKQFSQLNQVMQGKGRRNIFSSQMNQKFPLNASVLSVQKVLFS